MARYLHTSIRAKEHLHPTGSVWHGGKCFVPKRWFLPYDAEGIILEAKAYGLTTISFCSLFDTAMSCPRSIPLVRPSLRLWETLTLDIVVAFDYNRLGDALEEESLFIVMIRPVLVFTNTTTLIVLYLAERIALIWVEITNAVGYLGTLLNNSIIYSPVWIWNASSWSEIKHRIPTSLTIFKFLSRDVFSLSSRNISHNAQLQYI